MKSDTLDCMSLSLLAQWHPFVMNPNFPWKIVCSENRLIMENGHMQALSCTQIGFNGLQVIITVVLPLILAKLLQKCVPPSLRNLNASKYCEVPTDCCRNPFIIQQGRDHFLIILGLFSFSIVVLS
ncbi:hypothetical protein OG21DRAFT_1525180 [Imleria badia]|nr:hypothetical protein OG21DRAFT_1525180 [Imleria badia]